MKHKFSNLFFCIIRTLFCCFFPSFFFSPSLPSADSAAAAHPIPKHNLQQVNPLSHIHAPLIVKQSNPYFLSLSLHFPPISQQPFGSVCAASLPLSIFFFRLDRPGAVLKLNNLITCTYAPHYLHSLSSPILAFLVLVVRVQRVSKVSPFFL